MVRPVLSPVTSTHIFFEEFFSPLLLSWNNVCCVHVSRDLSAHASSCEEKPLTTQVQEKRQKKEAKEAADKAKFAGMKIGDTYTEYDLDGRRIVKVFEGFGSEEEQSEKSSSETDASVLAEGAGDIFDAYSDEEYYYDSDDENPIAFFIESLRYQDRLVTLGLRGNGISYNEDLLLYEALEFCGRLTTLDLGDNPHGVGGLRCLIRLVCSPGNNLANVAVGPDLRTGFEPRDRSFIR